jgi:hypothetical protein
LILDTFINIIASLYVLIEEHTENSREKMVGF